MAADDRVYLGVALERDGEPIRGTVRAGESAKREFSGWLEFMSVLETARAEAGTTRARGGCRGGSE